MKQDAVLSPTFPFLVHFVILWTNEPECLSVPCHISLTYGLTSRLKLLLFSLIDFGDKLPRYFIAKLSQA